MSQQRLPPPTAAVALGVLRAAPRLAPLALLISEFADVPRALTLPRAAASGSTRLFDRVAARLSDADSALREFCFARAMQVALERDDLSMAQRVHAHHPEPLFVLAAQPDTSLMRASTLELALRHGSLATVQWVVAHRRDRQCAGPGVQHLCRGCLYSALRVIGHGDVVRIVVWLLETGALPPMDARRLRVLRRALELSTDLVRWAHERKLIGETLGVELLGDAVTNYKPATALYLLEHGYRLDPAHVKTKLIRAATSGQERIVDALITYGECDAFQHEFKWAPVRPGGPRILQWRADCTSDPNVAPFTVGEFLRMGAYVDANVEMLQWLHANDHVTTATLVGLPWQHIPPQAAVLQLYAWLESVDLMDRLHAHDVTFAARSGYLRVLEWLDQRAPSWCWTPGAMDAAAASGQLAVLQWLHTNRSEGCTARAMDLAAHRGDLDTVKWLFTHRTERDVSSAAMHAAKGGHLDVLMWLLECTDECTGICTTCLAKTILSPASRTSGYPPSPYVLRWLESHAMPPCPSCPSRDENVPSLSMLDRALAADLDLVKYLYARDQEKSDVTIRHQELLSIVGAGHLPMLQWIVQHVVPTKKSSGDPERERDWDGALQEALIEALHTGQDHVAAWIQSTIDTER